MCHTPPSSVPSIIKSEQYFRFEWKRVPLGMRPYAVDRSPKDCTCTAVAAASTMRGWHRNVPNSGAVNTTRAVPVGTVLSRIRPRLMSAPMSKAARPTLASTKETLLIQSTLSHSCSGLSNRPAPLYALMCAVKLGTCVESIGWVGLLHSPAEPRMHHRTAFVTRSPSHTNNWRWLR